MRLTAIAVLWVFAVACGSGGQARSSSPELGDIMCVTEEFAAREAGEALGERFSSDPDLEFIVWIEPGASDPEVLKMKDRVSELGFLNLSVVSAAEALAEFERMVLSSETDVEIGADDLPASIRVRDSLDAERAEAIREMPLVVDVAIRPQAPFDGMVCDQSVQVPDGLEMCILGDGEVERLPTQTFVWLEPGAAGSVREEVERQLQGAGLDSWSFVGELETYAQFLELMPERIERGAELPDPEELPTSYRIDGSLSESVIADLEEVDGVREVINESVFDAIPDPVPSAMLCR